MQIDQIGLSCTDLDSAERFYCDVLGLTLADDIPGMAKVFGCDGVNIIMFKAEKIAPASVIYFKVEGVAGRIQERVEQLKSRGVKIEQEAQCIAPNWQGKDVYLGFFRDPFGNLLGLKSDVPAR
ncbi:MAG TPA: VOC family protein [Tepidisphaeraceae bacterium]|jgi:catechol 2,3-dioxygenase-like lactoylglutathione lyase family enzyme|nr:VOC family protein [Tepidisphaeraceae bacterium]